MAKVREVMPAQQPHAPPDGTMPNAQPISAPSAEECCAGVADMSVGSRVHRYGAWQMRVSDPPADWPTNLDTHSQRGMAMLLNAVNPATLIMDEHGECQLKLTAFICHVATAEDQETGEVDEAPRTVLIDASGKTFVTRSEHAPLKMQNFVSVFPKERWAAGIPIRIREHRSTRTKRTSHVIEIDLSQV